MELLEEARRGDLDEVKRLIQQHADVDTTNRSHHTALYFACKNGHTEVAQYLLDNGASVNLGAKPLISAVRYDHYDCVKLLLQYYADANCANTKGESPMTVALKKCRYSIILLLLRYGAIPSDSLDKIAFQLLECISSSGLDNVLLEKAGKLKLPREPLLHIACSFAAQWKTETDEATGGTRLVEHILSTVRRLLQQGVNVNAVSDKGDTALYRACISQQLKVVQVLVEAGADVTLTSRKLYPLIAACEAGNVELISLLMKAEVDVKCSNSNNETCLHAIINAYASITSSQKPVDNISILNIIKSFLEAGVDVNACCSQGETALYRASKAGHEQIVHLLLEAAAETSGSTRRRSLYAACEHGHKEIVCLLLRYGADPNASPTYSASYSFPISALCCAVKKGYTDIVNLLVAHGADVNKQDGSGKSALITFLELMISQRPKTSQASNLVEERDHNILRSMLLAGGDANVLSRSSGYNALHIASSLGMCDVMMELIRHGAKCNQLTSSGKSALDLACENGDEGAVELLLKHGANVNYSDKNGNTPLHLARSNAVIQTLLNAGANVNAMNDNGETALSVLCEKRQVADVNMVETYLKFNADPNIAFPLHAACQNNDIDTVRLLLAYGANANLVKEPAFEGLDDLTCGISMSARRMPVKVIKPSPLCIACKNGNTAIVDCLLTNGAAVTFADSFGNTPLDFALERLEEQVNSEEYDPIVTLLLKHNAPLNIVSYTGETPLYVACRKRLGGVVKQLLDREADVDLTTNDSKKYPLMIACERKFRDVAMMLLDRGADANVINDKQTPLILASANGDVVLVEQLLLCGANVNHMLGIGDTALHVAVVHAHRDSNKETFVSIVQRLLKSGAEPNAHNDRGETPLYLACNPTAAEVHIGIVQILLENGADPNIHACPPCTRSSSSPTSGDSTYLLPPLSLAAICGDSMLTTLLITFGARVNHSDGNGRTALHFAVGRGSVYCVRRKKLVKSEISIAEKLLSAGADVNAIDRNGSSPLYLACESGETEFVKLFLSHGANPNIETTDKYPIHAACRGQYYDDVKLLLEYNADVNVCDGSGKTALHYALGSKSNYYHRWPPDVCHRCSANTNALNDEGIIAYLADEILPSYYPSYTETKNRLTAIRSMLEHGANVNMLMPDGHSPLYLAVCALKREMLYENCIAKIVQLMVQYGAMLLDSSLEDIWRHSFNSGMLMALATFDGRQEFILEMFRARAGFQLIAYCCNAVSTSHWKVQSICLCQAAILDGYVPSAVEHLRLAQCAECPNAAGRLIQQLVNWLNEDRQQVPSLFRQCRIAIRRQLSVAVQFRTILLAIDRLPLPTDLKLYLQFAGNMMEIDLCCFALPRISKLGK